jgi:hypothetical protein
MLGSGFCSLANALVLEAKVRIHGRGEMKVAIRYENVPFFCFICGRIGHSDKECLDSELGDGNLNFGAKLRPSLRRDFGRLKCR